jgi:uncharacterized protein involved in exopolysaccharide biosynthesis
MTAEAEPLVIDLGSIGRVLRRRLSTVVGGAVVGGLVAAGILLFVPARYDGRAMMLIRTAKTPDPSSMVKDRLGPLSELMPSSMSLGGGSAEELATELALLQSRAVLGSVVDSLRLEVRPRSPGRVPPSAVVDSVRFPERFKPVKVSLVPGVNKLPQGTIWAKQRADVKLFDREDAIDELDNRLTIRKPGGEAVEINYKATDSVTAAQVPNLMAAVYMLRRKTVDRGLNQRKVEFLDAKSDSVRTDLRQAADVVANVARTNGPGALPEVSGKALADEIGALEAKLSEFHAGEVALDSLIVGVRARRLDPRLLTGFPDLLRSPVLNDLVGSIDKIETDRTVLVASRPDSSPQVVALTHAHDSLVAQLLPIANAYRESLVRQQMSVQRDLDGLRASLARLPIQAVAMAKEQAEVTKLGAMNAGMGAQVLSARLAALAEGGDVRLIDPAVSPRRVTFPRPVPTIAVCLAAGLLLGVVIALFGVSVVSGANAPRVEEGLRAIRSTESRGIAG